MKKILLFSRDPGGANTIIPLYKPLIKKGYNVSLVGKDVALQKYQDANLSAQNIMRFIKSITPDEIKSFIKSENPDFIITGTSSDDKTEKYIWKAAEELQIPSFAILDQWLNYAVRFSEYSASEIKEFKKNKYFLKMYLPTKILLMDEFARGEAINDGLSAENLIVTGQPYFETISSYKNTITENKLYEIKNKLGINTYEVIITFASEPFSTVFKDCNNPPFYWGYSEKTIFAELLKALEILTDELDKDITLVIRLHPKEDINSYDEIISNIKNTRIKIIIDKETNPWDLISFSDIVCGMASMFLIESAILKKNILSIQIGLQQENSFILTKKGIVPTILSYEELIKNLKRLLFEKNFSYYNFEIVENPVTNIISEMERLLWQN